MLRLASELELASDGKGDGLKATLSIVQSALRAVTLWMAGQVVTVEEMGSEQVEVQHNLHPVL